ncbi:SLAM family member 8-like isoform X1 [Corvus hawaiiensis]|uniref:SLAM family member 8-like isoform X1 n=1 Tax=Corvus moneduloides TaxID=1196302 RepID=UPI001363704B|nr:SLAM family member 8-like isoform X1 [Corvus moneduloides]XP_041876489.1 SLAM family member 8-like isoform X1 [Corvus kubaryi]XP_048144929.1 SLAM family member 8-like isoform X1 [Corvus hawaiiensis]
MERELPRSKSRLPSLLLALLGLGPGLLQEARFEADNEVLEMLAGNSTQSLLERCSELLFGQARAQPRQVNGVLGGSVLLSPALPPNKTVKEIEWSFSGGTGATIQVAEFGPGGFDRPDPKDRFGKRLEMYNETALRIRDLQRGDSGVFGARIKMQPALVDDQSFNLSVYESVPSPRTRSQLLASTVEWCNLTLQCQGAGKGAVNVTWKRDSLTWGSPGELGTDRHQLSPDGTTLRVALPPTAANVTYACTVSNPADHKVALFDLQALCQGGGGQSAFSKSGYIVLTLILVAVSLGGAFWCWRMNSGKAADPAATPTVPAEESPAEPQYSDIVCRSPPEGNDQGPSPPEAPQEPSETQKAEPQKEEAAAPKSPPGGGEQGQRPPEDTAEEVT